MGLVSIKNALFLYVQDLYVLGFGFIFVGMYFLNCVMFFVLQYGNECLKIRNCDFLLVFCLAFFENLLNYVYYRN